MKTNFIKSAFLTLFFSGLLLVSCEKEDSATEKLDAKTEKALADDNWDVKGDIIDASNVTGGKSPDNNNSLARATTYSEWKNIEKGHFAKMGYDSNTKIFQAYEAKEPGTGTGIFTVAFGPTSSQYFGNNSYNPWNKLSGETYTTAQYRLAQEANIKEETEFTPWAYTNDPVFVEKNYGTTNINKYNEVWFKKIRQVSNDFSVSITAGATIVASVKIPLTKIGGEFTATVSGTTSYTHNITETTEREIKFPSITIPPGKTVTYALKTRKKPVKTTWTIPVSLRGNFAGAFTGAFGAVGYSKINASLFNSGLASKATKVYVTEDTVVEYQVFATVK